MPRTCNLTLSRWHKVAERLAREYTETIYNAKQALTQTRVFTYLGETQEAALRAESEEWQRRLARAFRVQDAVADIRRALGEANAKNGVNAQLAELDKLNRRLKALTEIIEGQGADMIAIEELRNIPQDYMIERDRFDSTRPSLRVRLLDRDALSRLRQELETVRSRAYALSDEIAERNRATLTLELSEEIAGIAGL